MDKVVFKVLFDSKSISTSLAAGWGFACLVIPPGSKGLLLFDTANDGRALLNNLKAMGYQPSSVQRIVISHSHGDHTGGLKALLSKSPGATVFLPSGVERSLVRSIEQAGGTARICEKKTVLDDVFTVSGPLGGSIPEQALLINTLKGVVVLTGCAHPRIEKMLPRLLAMTRYSSIYGLIGGLHLFGSGKARTEHVIQSIREHRIELLAAGHCTGDGALSTFARAFPEKMKAIRSGTVIEISGDSSSSSSR